MARYRFSLQLAVSRAKGQNAVAKAAYNAREQLDNQRYGERTTNYAARGGREEILFAGIFADPKRGAPEWVQDRNALWNAAVAAEPNKNAREAQEIILNLPYELTQEQREFMLKDFVREHIVRGTGRIADVNMHKPPSHGDDRNIHAHILMTVRGVGPLGFEGDRLTIDPEQLVRLKTRWAERGAKELRKAGFELEADRWAVAYRDLKFERDEAVKRNDLEHVAYCDREAEKHRGPSVSALERRGIETDRGEIQRDMSAATLETTKLKSELADLQRLFELELHGPGPDWKRELAEIDRLIAGQDEGKQPIDWKRELAEIDELIAKHPESKEAESIRLSPVGPQLGRTAGEIRLAYALSETGQGFVNALEDRGLILARLSTTDAEKLNALDATRRRETKDPVRQKGPSWMASRGGVATLTPELLESAKRSYEAWDSDLRKRYSFESYVSYTQGVHAGEQSKSKARYQEGNLAVIDQLGHVHSLSRNNTGDTAKERNRHLENIERAPLMTVSEARRVMGDLYHHRREEKRVVTNERHWPVAAPEQQKTTTSPAYHFADAAREAGATQPVPQMPEGLRGTNAEIWAAYNLRTRKERWQEPREDGTARDRTRQVEVRADRDPYQFSQRLQDSGITLARVTKEDAARSNRESALAREIGRRAQVYREGEFVVVDKHSHVYRLTERNTRVSREEAQRFLGKAGWKGIEGLYAAKQRTSTHLHDRPEDLQGTALQIWKAHEGSKTAEHFVKRLNESGLFVAVVDAKDQAEDVHKEPHHGSESYVRRHDAVRAERGAFVVVDRKGCVFELDHRTTGRSEAGAQKFMATLDPKKFANVADTRALQQVSRQTRHDDRAAERLRKFNRFSTAPGREDFKLNQQHVQLLQALPGRSIKAVTSTVSRLLDGAFSILVPDVPKTPAQIEKQIEQAERSALQNEIKWDNYVYDSTAERIAAHLQERDRERRRDSNAWQKELERGGRDR